MASWELVAVVHPVGFGGSLHSDVDRILGVLDHPDAHIGEKPLGGES